MFSFIFDLHLALHYGIPTYSVKNISHHRPRGSVITDTTDRYGPIITVGGCRWCLESGSGSGLLVGRAPELGHHTDGSVVISVIPTKGRHCYYF